MSARSSPVAGPQLEAARLSLGSNVFLVIIKIAAGLAAGSLSVLAEGVQSVLDIFASAAILVAVRAANTPPDAAHPWGHGKLENLVSLAQMLLMLGSIVGIWLAAWHRFQNPEMPRISWGVAAIALSIAVNLAVSTRIARVAKSTQSAALAAESVHLRGDLWSCAGVLLGLGATQIWREPRLDPIFAAITALFAAITAIQLLRDTLRPLLDAKLPAAEVQSIRHVLENDPRVLDFHKLRTRQAGSFRLADVHVMLDDELSFSQAHRISEEIEDAIRAALPNLDIIVHAEPFEEEREHQATKHRIERENR